MGRSVSYPSNAIVAFADYSDQPCEECEGKGYHVCATCDGEGTVMRDGDEVPCPNHEEPTDWHYCQAGWIETVHDWNDAVAASRGICR